jgi:thiol:disulfide interchange protein DsbD
MALRIAALCLIATAARGAGLELPAEQPKLLPPEQAFRFSARAVDPTTLEARFDVADGYYLYRDKLHFQLDAAPASLGPTSLPAGARKHDQFFGDVEIYRGAVTIKLKVAGSAPRQALILVAESQGCADAGVCYPPTRQQVRLTVPPPGSAPGPQVEAAPPRKGLFN